MTVSLVILCGGPSEERGISINSTRSFLDHTSSLSLEIQVIYLNPKGLFYKLSKSELYSNTPSDFDFKLSQDGILLKEAALIDLFQKVDLVVPLIHGSFGEDGRLQEWLERSHIPFIGSSSEVCKSVFNKYRAQQRLIDLGFPVFPTWIVTQKEIDQVWHSRELKEAIIKPTESGSSLGVTYVDSLSKAKEAIISLQRMGFQELVLEPYHKMTEFTICVIESEKGEAIALTPLEIDKGERKILDYRGKYLPSPETRYYCPPRFDETLIHKLRKEAESLFRKLGLRDFARIDGWMSKEGTFYFSDFNPISGMEQNSFLFQQAAKSSLNHADLFQIVIQRALARSGSLKRVSMNLESKNQKERVSVLMGGSTAERHVSIMSGTNVWLKLRQAKEFEAIPFLLDLNHDVWKLPYAYTLHHTAEEMIERCEAISELDKKAFPIALEIRQRLGLEPISGLEKPVKMTLAEFLENLEGFLFIALHGGIGEDGTLQRMLEEKGILYNGSDSTVSARCMDKHATALITSALQDGDILAMPQISFEASPLFGHREKMEKLWNSASILFETELLLIKPRNDGCSAGVARLYSVDDLMTYLLAVQKGIKVLPPQTLKGQINPLEMPLRSDIPFLLEPFIITDQIYIEGVDLCHEIVSGWCEMTIGVLEKMGECIALSPSITIAKNHVLSVEEKFQGGTGINLTPPPLEILSEKARSKVQESVIKLSRRIGISNYARFDLFVECATGRIRLIEINTLPALTPSTVFYHQALTLDPPIFPKELLSMIISQAKWRHIQKRIKELSLETKAVSLLSQ